MALQPHDGRPHSVPAPTERGMPRAQRAFRPLTTGLFPCVRHFIPPAHAARPALTGSLKTRALKEAIAAIIDARDMASLTSKLVRAPSTKPLLSPDPPDRYFILIRRPYPKRRSIDVR